MSPYRTPDQPALTVEDLVFVASGGKVAALHRASGEVLWKQKVGDSFVSIVYDPPVGLLVGTAGEVWCLDPMTGGQRWHNQLKGFGHGAVSIATTRAATARDGLGAASDDADAAAAGAAVVVTS